MHVKREPFSGKWERPKCAKPDCSDASDDVTLTKSNIFVGHITPAADCWWRLLGHIRAAL